MNPEQIEWLRGWARKNHCKLVIDGQIGFGRQCVGIQADEVNSGVGALWVNYGWYGYAGDRDERRAVNQIVNNAAPPDAYHKDEYLAVLGEGFEALEQLYDWVQALDKAGLTTELVDEADLGEGTSTINILMTGKRAKERILCRA